MGTQRRQDSSLQDTMPRSRADNSRFWRASGCGTLLGILFGLPFAAAGVFVAALMVKSLAAHHATQSWVETPALVTRAELVVHDDDDEGTTYQATAEYEYDYAGQHYRGSRVGLHPGSDNVGDYQQRIHAELKSHQTSGQPFRCYVNPAAPDEAILYRDLRWELIAFYDIFILVFGGFGGLLTPLCWFALRRARTRTRLAAEYPDEPWLWRADWAAGRVEDAGRLWLLSAVGAALFWNLSTAPLWFLLPPEILNGNLWAHLSAVLPLVGLGLAFFAIRLVRRRLKYGPCVFQMASLPGVIGGELAGTIETTGDIEPTREFNLLLHCERKVTTSQGDETRTRTEEVWRSEQTVMPETGRTGAAIPVRFAIPSNCPPSAESDAKKVEWRLTATADVPGVAFKAEYLVPVFQAAAGAGPTGGPGGS